MHHDYMFQQNILWVAKDWKRFTGVPAAGRESVIK
jgi:hypothetical protein